MQNTSLNQRLSIMKIIKAWQKYIQHKLTNDADCVWFSSASNVCGILSGKISQSHIEVSSPLTSTLFKSLGRKSMQILLDTII